MYYYYSITNDINNKKYIGITTNPIARKNRHFNYLEQNKHFNPKLQNAFNKYGKTHFSFDVIEAIDYRSQFDAYNHEAELIQKYDTQNNGYNCNPGGYWTGPRGKFTELEVLYIKSACYYDSGVTGVLAKMFECSSSTINNIRIGDNYKPWCYLFDNLTEEEKFGYYEDFCSSTNYSILKYSKSKSARLLNKDQIFAILLNDEFKYTTFANLRRAFGFEDDHRYVFADIRKGKTYKEHYHAYQLLNLDQKQELLCHYTEMYK